MLEVGDLVYVKPWSEIIEPQNLIGYEKISRSREGGRILSYFAFNEVQVDAQIDTLFKISLRHYSESLGVYVYKLRLADGKEAPGVFRSFYVTENMLYPLASDESGEPLKEIDFDSLLV